MSDDNLHRQSIVACIWDFDKTLINGYMQTPIFRHFGVNEKRFWDEVNAMPAIYADQGMTVATDIIYLNHLLTYVRAGRMKGLNNALLKKLGAELEFFPGLPDFFETLKAVVAQNPLYASHHISLEHYIVSTGLAEMIKGSQIAEHVDGIFGCAFIENPLPPGYLDQTELELESEREIGQIGIVVDNTVKTRFIFEIKKGSNKNAEIDVNAKMRGEDQRVPMRNMIYMADGPSDVPAFAVIKKFGGRAFGVYNPERDDEFAQNDNLLQMGRIDAYGPTDYTSRSATFKWIKLHVEQICERIIRERDFALANRVSKPPRHLHEKEKPQRVPELRQQEIFNEPEETVD